MNDTQALGRETAIGAAVVLAGIALLVFAYGSAGRTQVAGYELLARFNKIDGIGIGSDVRLAGITEGKVVSSRLDDKFRAVVTLRIDPGVQLPDDSAALVETDGLLGSKFISLQPGADEAALKPGAEFRFTQDSMNVTDILDLIISQAKAKRAEAPPPAAK